MTPDQDCFRMAARRFLAAFEVEGEEQAAGGLVSKDGNKDKENLVIELENDRLGGDRLREGPEEVTTTIRVDGEDREVEVLKYPNGSMKDAKTGRFLVPPSPNVFEDPEKARKAITTRHNRVLEQARAGLVAGVRRSGEHDVETPAEAWAAIVEEQAVLAMGDKRGSTASARLVGSATKMISDEKQEQRVDVGAVVVVSMDAVLLGMFSRIYPDDPQRALSEMRNYKDRLR